MELPGLDGQNDLSRLAVENRPRNLGEELAAFPYVNGELFAERLGFAVFNRAMRERLLETTDFQWARVSPAVFGSLFQGISEDAERRQQGAHYTSERDILKLIRSLFLDDLVAEFERLRQDRSTRRANLLAFHDRLRAMRFLDPACGCGNFLVLAYRELRALELELLRELHAAQQLLDVHGAIRVDVDQFYGIELAEWPCRIAEVALWLMDHQMNVRVSEAFGERFERLPLRATPHIVRGNALTMDWRAVLPPAANCYVLGNPPFVGKQFRTDEQQGDMDRVWRGVPGARVLDYVTCWYRLAASYIDVTDPATGAPINIPVAFVSTNSIAQGEQVGILWGTLLAQSIKINFAHRTFAWTSEARGRAHVHVVIIGFGRVNAERKRIYEYDPESGAVTVSEVANINPYLVAASDVVVQKRTQPLCRQPQLVFGSMPNDGGHLLLTDDEKNDLVARDARVLPYIRQLVGSEEFINGVKRWCLWLVDASPAELRQLPDVMRRVDGVRTHRLASRRETTRELANTPTLFGEIRQPRAEYLLIPGVSSENRRYIPMAFMRPEVIASNLVYCLEGATKWHFGVLTSAMHMAWVNAVCGRLESRYRYSNNLVYNNLPWPRDVPANRQQAVINAADAVLAAREALLPPRGINTYADLYDPLTMPAALARAHAELDREVDRCYRGQAFRSDRERVEHLFEMYSQLTAPLIPRAPERRGRRRAEAV